MENVKPMVIVEFGPNTKVVLYIEIAATSPPHKNSSLVGRIDQLANANCLTSTSGEPILTIQAQADTALGRNRITTEVMSCLREAGYKFNEAQRRSDVDSTAAAS